MIHFLVNGLMFGYVGGAIFATTSFDNQDEEASIGLFTLDGRAIQPLNETQRRKLRKKTHQALQQCSPTLLDSMARIEECLEDIDEFVFWVRYAGQNSQERLAFLFEIQGAEKHNREQALQLYLRNPFVNHYDPAFCALCRDKLLQLQQKPLPTFDNLSLMPAH